MNGLWRSTCFAIKGETPLRFAKERLVIFIVLQYCAQPLPKERSAYPCYSFDFKILRTASLKRITDESTNRSMIVLKQNCYLRKERISSPFIITILRSLQLVLLTVSSKKRKMIRAFFSHTMDIDVILHTVRLMS